MAAGGDRASSFGQAAGGDRASRQQAETAPVGGRAARRRRIYWAALPRGNRKIVACPLPIHPFPSPTHWQTSFLQHTPPSAWYRGEGGGWAEMGG